MAGVRVGMTPRLPTKPRLSHQDPASSRVITGEEVPDELAVLDVPPRLSAHAGGMDWNRRPEASQRPRGVSSPGLMGDLATESMAGCKTSSASCLSSAYVRHATRSTWTSRPVYQQLVVVSSPWGALRPDVDRH